MGQDRVALGAGEPDHGDPARWRAGGKGTDRGEGGSKGRASSPAPQQTRQHVCAKGDRSNRAIDNELKKKILPKISTLELSSSPLQLPASPPISIRDPRLADDEYHRYVQRLQRLRDGDRAPATGADISFLRDSYGHGRLPRVPLALLEVKPEPSVVPSEWHVVKWSPFPLESALAEELEVGFDEASRMYYVKLFPKLVTGRDRRDVVQLARWLQAVLEAGRLDDALKGREKGLLRLRYVEKALSSALHELMRQVAFHSIERGKLVKRLLSFHLTLFQRLLILEKEATDVDFPELLRYSFFSQDLYIYISVLK
jgi:hypothetical protein